MTKDNILAHDLSKKKFTVITSSMTHKFTTCLIFETEYLEKRRCARTKIPLPIIYILYILTGFRLNNF